LHLVKQITQFGSLIEKRLNGLADGCLIREVRQIRLHQSSRHRITRWLKSAGLNSPGSPH